MAHPMLVNRHFPTASHVLVSGLRGGGHRLRGGGGGHLEVPRGRRRDPGDTDGGRRKSLSPPQSCLSSWEG